METNRIKQAAYCLEMAWMRTKVRHVPKAEAGKTQK